MSTKTNSAKQWHTDEHLNQIVFIEVLLKLNVKNYRGNQEIDISKSEKPCECVKIEDFLSDNK